MTDVSFAAMSLLVATGGLLVAIRAIPLLTGRAFIYAGTAVLCARATGIKIVAPISAAGGETLSWIAFFLMTAIILFLAGRGLVRTVQQEKTAASNATT